MQNTPTHEQEVRAMFADDPHVSPYWFGLMVAEAKSRDDAEAAVLASEAA